MGLVIRITSLEPDAAPVATREWTLREAASGLKIGRSATCDLVLPHDRISRVHASISREGDRITLLDEGSANGVVHRGKKVKKLILSEEEQCRIGPYELTLRLSPDPGPDDERIRLSGGGGKKGKEMAGTRLIDPGEVLPGIDVPADDVPAVFRDEIVSEGELVRQGIPVDQTVYGVVGGGVGSFIFVDHLRVFGVRKEMISVIGLEEVSYHKYRRLCRNSQIPDHERLRSNSESCPDNIWGYPGYALRESIRELAGLRLVRAFYPLWQVFWEPIVQSYTPRAGDVFRSIDREERRIGWLDMFRKGLVKRIRLTDGGRYAVYFSDKVFGGHRILLCNHVHLALGYPGTRFLEDLREYRGRTKDRKRVVNAYEDHDDVYRDLLAKGGGTVLLRGRGIVASRIVQRLYETRKQGADIRVIHLMRSKLFVGARYGAAKRLVRHHWEYQPFNWPKSCWGGELRSVLAAADDRTRSRLYQTWGGTTTADRQDWKRMLDEGLLENWYLPRFGDVKSVHRLETGKVRTSLTDSDGLSQVTNFDADYIIDCTGLVPDIQDNELIADLLSTYRLPRNMEYRADGKTVAKGLRVNTHFEVPEMRNGYGRFFASGQITSFGPMAAVDSFLGLQYSALHSIEALRNISAPGIRGMSWFRSFAQWLKWLSGATP